MEFFSLLTVAKEYNIPAGGIFVVTNYISRDAHKEYLTNISKAKEILQSYIMSRFKGIE
jgi:hypothetical protein